MAVQQLGTPAFREVSMMDTKTKRRIKAAAKLNRVVSFHYVKNDGTDSRRNVMLQPPINPPEWFDENEYVYGVDLDKSAPIRVQVWRLDSIDDIAW